MVDIDKPHSEQLTDVWSYHLLSDGHLNVINLPTFLKVCSIQSDQMSFVGINLSTENMYLEKHDILGFFWKKVI